MHTFRSKNIIIFILQLHHKPLLSFSTSYSFATKFRTTFNFIEVFTDDKPDICATIIQNTSKHIATLPTGQIGYIEVPITNEKPKFFQVNDINTLIHNVTHTYHPEITEPLHRPIILYNMMILQLLPTILSTSNLYDK